MDYDYHTSFLNLCGYFVAALSLCVAVSHPLEVIVHLFVVIFVSLWTLLQPHHDFAAGLIKDLADHTVPPCCLSNLFLNFLQTHRNPCTGLHITVLLFECKGRH